MYSVYVKYSNIFIFMKPIKISCPYIQTFVDIYFVLQKYIKVLLIVPHSQVVTDSAFHPRVWTVCNLELNCDMSHGFILRYSPYYTMDT